MRPMRYTGIVILQSASLALHSASILTCLPLARFDLHSSVYDLVCAGSRPSSSRSTNVSSCDRLCSTQAAVMSQAQLYTVPEALCTIFNAAVLHSFTHVAC